MNKVYNVLSLFNGMSTGHVAMNNLGLKIGKYYSSEIKPAALKHEKYHFPNNIQLGDVTRWKEWDIDLASIDIIFSGSPCKDLSIAGKRAGIYGANSGLFWNFVDILNHVRKLNPNVLFLQENVYTAPKKDIGIMSMALGVYPIMIDSADFTAQRRKRWYWSNILTVKKGLFGDTYTAVLHYSDAGIEVKDIIVSGYSFGDKLNTILESESRPFADSSKSYLKFKTKSLGNVVLDIGRNVEPKTVELLKRHLFVKNGELCVSANTKDGLQIFGPNKVMNLAFLKSGIKRGRVSDSKIHTLMEGNEPLYVLDKRVIRLLSQTELERAQGFNDGFTKPLTRNQAASLLGDGWTLPVIEHLLKPLK